MIVTAMKIILTL